VAAEKAAAQQASAERFAELAARNERLQWQRQRQALASRRRQALEARMVRRCRLPYQTQVQTAWN
jgi:hypothetical protein